MWRLISIVLVAVVTCQNVFPTEEPLPSCKGHDPDKYFTDPNNASIFYRCSQGKCVGRFYCHDGLVFNEDKQSCVQEEILKCPKANGTFAYPGDRHKYIECYEGQLYVMNCSGNLVFDEKVHTCVFDNSTTSSQPQTTEASVQTTGTPVETTKAPVDTTIAPVKTTTTPKQTTKSLKALKFVYRARRLYN